MQSRTVILLQNACNNILEIFSELGETLQNQLNYLLRPLAGLVPLERGVLVNKHLTDSVLCDLLHLLRVEISVVFEFLCHIECRYDALTLII